MSSPRRSHKRKQASLTSVVVLLLIIGGVIWLSHGSNLHATPTPAPTITNPGATSPAFQQPSGGARGVFIEPKDGDAPVIDELDAAERSIDVEVYLLSEKDVFAALKR